MASIYDALTKKNAPKKKDSNVESQNDIAITKPTDTGYYKGPTWGELTKKSSTPKSSVVEKSPIPTLGKVDDSAYKASVSELTKRKKTYGDTLTELYENLQKDTRTPEQIEKERKKGKRRAIVGSLFDNLTALSNLITTNKGAANVYDPSQSLSAKRYGEWTKKKAKYDAAKAAQMKAKVDAAAQQYKSAREGVETAREDLDKARKQGLDEYGAKLRAWKYGKDVEGTEGRLTEQQRHNKASEAIQKTRASISAARGGSGSSSEKKREYDNAVAALFYELPENIVKDNRKPQFNRWGGIEGYLPISSTDMVKVINKYISENINSDNTESRNKAIELNRKWNEIRKAGSVSPTYREENKPNKNLGLKKSGKKSGLI